MKILLLTDIPPCTNHTSGIVINKWCDFLLEDNHKLFCSLIKNKDIEVLIPKDKMKKIQFLNIEKPREDYGIQKNKIKSFFCSLINNTKTKIIDISRIGKKVVNFIDNNDIEIILCSIQGQTMTYLIRYIQKHNKAKCITQTWDPLIWWLNANKMDFLTRYFDLKKFNQVLKHSDNFMAMSWAMNVYFTNKIKCNCVTNLPSLNKSKYISKVNNRSNFIIGFSGQTYSNEEIDCLLETLKEMNWELNNKKIYLKVYGSYFDERFNDIHIINSGFINQNDLIKELKYCDLLYCPYWFNKKFIEPCLLSFPGKLITYLSTGRTILMHSPKYASPYKLLKHFNIALFCNKLDKNSLKLKIIEALSNDYSVMNKRQLNVFNKYFTYESMRKNLFVSLGLINKGENNSFEKLKKIYQ